MEYNESVCKNFAIEILKITLAKQRERQLAIFQELEVAPSNTLLQAYNNTCTRIIQVESALYNLNKIEELSKEHIKRTEEENLHELLDTFENEDEKQEKPKELGLFDKITRKLKRNE